MRFILRDAVRLNHVSICSAADSADDVGDRRRRPRRALALPRADLEIAVERHDDVAARLREPGHHGRVLTVVAVQQHGDDVRGVAFGCRGEHLSRAVLAAVVDEHDFERAVERTAHLEAAPQELREVGLLVIDRDHDRHAARFHRRLVPTTASIAATTRSTSPAAMSGNSGNEHTRAEFHSVFGSGCRGA